MLNDMKFVWWNKLPLALKGFIVGNIVHVGYILFLLLTFILSKLLTVSFGYVTSKVAIAWVSLVFELTIGIPDLITSEIFAYYCMSSFGYFLDHIAFNLLIYGLFGVIFFSLNHFLKKKGVKNILVFLILSLIFLPIPLYFVYTYQLLEDINLKDDLVRTCFDFCNDEGGSSVFLATGPYQYNTCECRDAVGKHIKTVYVDSSLIIIKDPAATKPDKNFESFVEDWLPERTPKTYTLANLSYEVEVLKFTIPTKKVIFRINDLEIELGDWDRVTLDDGTVFGVEYLPIDLRCKDIEQEFKANFFIGRNSNKYD